MLGESKNRRKAAGFIRTSSSKALPTFKNLTKNQSSDSFSSFEADPNEQCSREQRMGESGRSEGESFSPYRDGGRKYGGAGGGAGGARPPLPGKLRNRDGERYGYYQNNRNVENVDGGRGMVGGVRSLEKNREMVSSSQQAKYRRNYVSIQSMEDIKPNPNLQKKPQKQPKRQQNLKNPKTHSTSPHPTKPNLNLNNQQRQQQIRQTLRKRAQVEKQLAQIDQICSQIDDFRSPASFGQRYRKIMGTMNQMNQVEEREPLKENRGRESGYGYQQEINNRNKSQRQISRQKNDKYLQIQKQRQRAKQKSIQKNNSNRNSRQKDAKNYQKSQVYSFENDRYRKLSFGNNDLHHQYQIQNKSTQFPKKQPTPHPPIKNPPKTPNNYTSQSIQHKKTQHQTITHTYTSSDISNHNQKQIRLPQSSKYDFEESQISEMNQEENQNQDVGRSSEEFGGLGGGQNKAGLSYQHKIRDRQRDGYGQDQDQDQESEQYSAFRYQQTFKPNANEQILSTLKQYKKLHPEQFNQKPKTNQKYPHKTDQNHQARSHKGSRSPLSANNRNINFNQAQVQMQEEDDNELQVKNQHDIARKRFISGKSQGKNESGQENQGSRDSGSEEVQEEQSQYIRPMAKQHSKGKDKQMYTITRNPNLRAAMNRNQHMNNINVDKKPVYLNAPKSRTQKYRLQYSQDQQENSQQTSQQQSLINQYPKQQFNSIPSVKQCVRLSYSPNTHPKNPHKKLLDNSSGIYKAKGGICFDLDVNQFTHMEPLPKNSYTYDYLQDGRARGSAKNKGKVNTKQEILKRRELAKNYDKVARAKVFGGY